MNPQTSGCIRHVRSRNSPRSGGDGRRVAEQVLEHRHAGAAGMNALRHVRQLLRIAEQHDVARARAHRHGIGQRHLAGLVDEQVVELALHLLAREQP